MATKKTKKSSATKTPGKEKLTRIEILRSLAEQTGLAKVQVESVFHHLSEMIQSHMKKRGSGEFIIPMAGIKIRRIKKKASKAVSRFSPLKGKQEKIQRNPARFPVNLSE